MGDYSHSDALILEVYHILCTGSKVNIPCAQLCKVMTTKMSSDIGGLLCNIDGFVGLNTSLRFAYITTIYTGGQAHRTALMDIRIIHFTLEPIRRSMYKTRDIIVTVSSME
jgi:hypothetical protein